MENSLDTNLFLYLATSSSYYSWTASPTAQKVSFWLSCSTHFEATVTVHITKWNTPFPLSTEPVQNIHWWIIQR